MEERSSEHPKRNNLSLSSTVIVLNVKYKKNYICSDLRFFAHFLINLNLITHSNNFQTIFHDVSKKIWPGGWLDFFNIL
jgi:hypothetical protein